MKALIITTLMLSSTAFAEWKSNSELGLVSQSGNTNQDNTYINTEITKESGKNSYKVFGSYINTNGETNGQNETLAESASAGLKYTRKLSEKMGIYAGGIWEKNRFAGYDDRYSADLGFRYDFAKEDNWFFYNETGYRYRSQFAHTLGDTVGEKTESNFGRVFFDYGRKFTPTANFRFWVESLYDFSDSDNIEVNFEPSVDVALGNFGSEAKPARVSLKLAYKGMYDNVPAVDGLKKYDSIFSTSIKVLY